MVKINFKTKRELTEHIESEGNYDQIKAINDVFVTNDHLFITGRAGSGKTTFMKRIYPHLGACAIVAPTGIAAINAEGTTMHSFFGLDLDPYIPDRRGDCFFTRKNGMSSEAFQRIANLNTLIIDEISMVRCDTLDKVADTLRYVKYYRNRKKIKEYMSKLREAMDKNDEISAAKYDKKINEEKEKMTDPFGKVRLIMFGDMSQLPPIVPDNEADILENYYNDKFFFYSKSLMVSGFKMHNFSKAFRQSDTTFVDILDHIRTGSVTDEDLDIINNRVQDPADMGVKYMNIVPKNEQAARINLENLADIDGTEYVLDATTSGDYPKNAPCEKVLHLKVGAQVVITKNDTSGELNYVNGSLGTVVSIQNPKLKGADEEEKEEHIYHKVNVRIEATGNVHGFYPAIWENTKYKDDGGELIRNITGYIKQYPMKLGWASSIHKVQGLTLDAAYINTNTVFEAGQAYVALSRCRSLEGLYLMNKLRKEHAIICSDISDFYKKSEENGGVFSPIPIDEVFGPEYTFIEFLKQKKNNANKCKQVS